MSKDTAGDALSLWVATETNRGSGCWENYRDHNSLRRTKKPIERSIRPVKTHSRGNVGKVCRKLLFFFFAFLSHSRLAFEMCSNTHVHCARLEPVKVQAHVYFLSSHQLTPSISLTCASCKFNLSFHVVFLNHSSPNFFHLCTP